MAVYRALVCGDLSSWEFMDGWVMCTLPPHGSGTHQGAGYQWETSYEGRKVAMDDAAAKALADAKLRMGVLEAVQADIAALEVSGGIRQSLASLALWTAGVIQSRGAEGGAASSAALAKELRTTLLALVGRGEEDVDDIRSWYASRMSTPVGHTEDSVQVDLRPEVGGDGSAAR